MSKCKSTLKSFSFGSYKGVDELPEEVMSLFLGMVGKPEKNVEFADEIINAGLDGRINFNKIFNLDAYEYTIRNNTRMNVEKERSKKTFIDFGSSDSERDSSIRNGGITIDSVSASAIEDLKDAYEEVALTSELKYAVDTIKGLNDDFVDDYGINLIGLIKKAVVGFPQAVTKLKDVCDEFKIVSEQVEIILKSGQDVESCFA